MAVSNLWPVKYNLGQVINYAANPDKTDADTYTQEQYQALADVLSYAKNEEKTEKQFYVQGINCDPEIARTQYINIKKDSIRQKASRRIMDISVLMKTKLHRHNARR